MNLPEESIDAIPSMIDGHVLGYQNEGEGLVCMGSCHNWHRFYYSDWFETDTQTSGGHGEFRCKDLKLTSLKNGKEIKNGSMMRVISIDLDSRIIILDPPDFEKIMEESLMELESEAEKSASQSRDR